MDKQEIILIRHGKPLSATNQRLSAGGFAQWVRQYNKSSLDPASQPAQKVNLAEHYHISSDLVRARLSAAHYSSLPLTEISPLFREMDIPRYRVPVRLRAWTWVFINRAIWMAGRQGRFESYREAKDRAEQAVNLLEARATEHGKVVVFGHGMFNRQLRLILAKRGWQVEEKDNRYWGVNTLRYHQQNSLS